MTQPGGREPVTPGLRAGFLDVLLIGGTTGDFRLRGPALPGTVVPAVEPARLRLAVDSRRRQWAQPGQLRNTSAGAEISFSGWVVEEYVHDVTARTASTYRSTVTRPPASVPTGPVAGAPAFAAPGVLEDFRWLSQQVTQQAGQVAVLCRRWTPQPVPQVVVDAAHSCAADAREANLLADGRGDAALRMRVLSARVDEVAGLLLRLRHQVLGCLTPDPDEVAERLRLTVAAAAELTGR